MSERFYLYGMRLRGFSPGCQPKDGLLGRVEDNTALYHDVLAYSRPLTPKELRDYELDPIRYQEREGEE